MVGVHAILLPTNQPSIKPTNHRHSLVRVGSYLPVLSLSRSSYPPSLPSFLPALTARASQRRHLLSSSASLTA